MSRSLGIDFGYSTATASLGYIRFETQTSEGKATVSVESPSRISTLANFKTEVLKDACGNGVSVIALDAPITPKRISGKPKSGRQVEKRFARGYLAVICQTVIGRHILWGTHQQEIPPDCSIGQSVTFVSRAERGTVRQPREFRALAGIHRGRPAGVQC